MSAVSDTPFRLYADGSCLKNPGGPGGWGVVIVYPDGSKCEYNGSDPSTTNNRMELTAAIEGLRRLPEGSRVVLCSDSEYVVKTMNLGWKRKMNLDLWKQLDSEVARRPTVFEWVRGHGVDVLNNRADQLANEAARAAAAQNAHSADVSPPRNDSSEKIKSLLKPGEAVRICSECGRQFVSRENASPPHCCSLVPCQLRARRGV